jgi:Zn-dependent M28 family amino/carboxypeptidase
MVIQFIMDNGTAISAMLETAKAVANLKQKPEHLIVFISVTAEETGIHGSKYYVENGIFPPEKTIANLNYELLLPIGRMKQVVLKDAKLFFKIGYKLANESSFSKWSEKSEFKAIREK